MKNLCSSLAGFITLLALTTIGCTKSKESAWINLEKAEVTLPSTGETSVTINVDASTNWTATPDATWITLTEQTATSIVVTADDNDNIERDAKIEFTAGDAKATLTIHQLEAPGLPAHFRKMDEYDAAAISPSGTYIAAMKGDVDNGTYITHAYRVDVATDERKFINTYSYEFSAPCCITDDGASMFYSQGWVNTVLVDAATGEDFKLVFDDLASIGTPRITCVSRDGRIWGGYFDGGKDGAVPYKFVDGMPAERLETPDTNFRGQPREADGLGGFTLRGGSADGSMFYGASWDNLDFGMCYWDKEGKFHWVGGDNYKTSKYETTDKYGQPKTVYVVDWGVQCTDELFKMSPNGKYIGCTIYQETYNEAEGAALGSVTGAGVFDTETEEMIMMPSGSTVMNITDSGLAVIADGSPLGSSSIYDLNTGTMLGSGTEWVRENFGISIPGDCIVTGIFGENDDVVFGVYVPTGGMLVYRYWYAARN